MPKVHRYWISSYGLVPDVLEEQLPYFLGGGTTFKPYRLDGRHGYLIEGVLLTRAQIEDLTKFSWEYERDKTVEMLGRSAVRHPNRYIVHEVFFLN
ncbi:hypothetical protein BDV25DRAFT_150552 [Aspergillus avenaceus]|uniref:Uncharacterized protein n=1 Tax=Aspergillus avenaceus TaxID=36643 RepID=A0A5N6U209_ASPAV|nr:hypothetical protein BDV25DRAFT_150552 [Aspergillus avenaceus]